VNYLESEVLRKLHERIIKGFMDIIVLSKLRSSSLSGYDIIAFIHDKYGLLISSGTVYSLLYSLERDGLIKGRLHDRRRIYTLTRKGEETIKLVLQSSDKLQKFVMNIFNK
jgi:DNA-binding PadR family transcriptional regulator